MHTDNSQPDSHEIYYAAEKYLPYLSDSLQTQIKTLLTEVRDGQKRDTNILSLLGVDSEARKWMRQALFGEPNIRSYSQLTGVGPLVPANSQWKCPQCGFLWHVQRKGRPVPYCPKDESVLLHVEK